MGIVIKLQCHFCGKELHCGAKENHCWCFEVERTGIIEGKGCFCESYLMENSKRESKVWFEDETYRVDISLPTETKRSRISGSKMLTFQGCRHKFLHEVVLKTKRRPQKKVYKPAMVGNIIQKLCADWVNEGRPSHKIHSSYWDKSMAELFRNNADYADCVSSYTTSELEILKMETMLCFDMFKGWNLTNFNDKKAISETEFLININILSKGDNKNYDFLLSGHTDFVYFKNSDEVYILDGKAHKERSKPDRFGEDYPSMESYFKQTPSLLQLVHYHALVSALYKVYGIGFYMYSYRKWEDFPMERMDEAKKFYTDILVDSKTTSKFPATEFYCDNCDFKYACELKGNE